MSQTRFVLKYHSHALLMLPIVISSDSSKGTNSRGPILVYFWAFPETSAESLWTVNSSLFGRRRWSLGGSFFVRFALTFSLSVFHASAMMTYSMILNRRAMHAGSGSARLRRKFYLILTLISFHFTLVSLSSILISVDFIFAFFFKFKKWKPIRDKNKKDSKIKKIIPSKCGFFYWQFSATILL